MTHPTPHIPLTTRSQLGPPIVVDTHVHIHDCFHLGGFLVSAASNFDSAARDHATNRQAAGALMLTEVDGVCVFDALKAASDSQTGQLGDWRVYSTPDPGALLFESPSTMPLLLVAGRQIRVQAGLEVLALGCLETFRDGMPIEAALHQARECGSLPVLPWGFGKWTLARGRRIRGLIAGENPDAFCLGDVGGRWRGLSEPGLLAEGRSLGYAVLPGSDPLPFPEQVSRAGSSGLVLPISLYLDHPTESLLQSLRRANSDVVTYMDLESLAPFVQHQLRMQVRKL